MKPTIRLKLRKYQNKLIGIGVLALIIWAVIVAAKPGPSNSGVPAEPSNATNNALVANTPSFDFGTLSMAAGKVTRTVSVKNDGTVPVTVKKLYTSCMCTTAAMVKDGQTYGPFGMPMHAPIPEINQTLNPGATADITVTFDPAAHGPAGVGKISRVVYLENSAGAPYEIKFSAFVKP